MIYIADGITDIPCMRLVKEYGGHSIAVYNPKSNKSQKVAQELIADGRVNFMAEANYEENSKMEILVEKIFENIASNLVLKEFEGVTK